MKRALRFLAPLCALTLLVIALAPKPTHSQAQVVPGYEGPIFAADFAHWTGRVSVGTTAGNTGSYTITMNRGYEVNTRNVSFVPYNVETPITVGVGATQETVTPTAVSGCGVNSSTGTASTCQITATFTYTHGTGTPVTTGDYGLEEAIQFLQPGGGQVMIDQQWYGMGATGNTLYSAVPMGNVNIVDVSQNATQYWTTTPATTSALAAPSALTAAAACVVAGAQFCSDANVAGSASWGGTVHGCFTLVDIMGNESPCSSDISFTSVASKAIDMGDPAAVTSNVVGWKPYVSVSGGTYALSYSMPLLTQPTVLQAVPVSAGVCTLTKLETVTPACAIGNTTYGQAASTTGAGTLFAGGAQFTSYPVVTNTLAPEIGSASATAYNPNEEAHATYRYAPGSHVGLPGIQSAHFVFPITAAAQTTVGEISASIPLSANFMNYPGRTLRVCGNIAKTSTTADTVDSIQLWWDAEGSNVTAGTPVELSSINITEAVALAAAANFHFCQDIITTIASTSATGGTITPGTGWATVSQVSAGANPSGGSSSLVAAVGSLNLALPAHVSVLFTHSTGTDGAGSKLYGLTAQIVN